MVERDNKLQVLETIAGAFRERKVVWAVGGSLLLYFKGKVSAFGDIDLMVADSSVEAARAALLELGTLAPPKPQGRYRTRCFLEFTIQGVEVDLMGGMVILKEGKAYDCALLPEQIREWVKVGQESIPLQPLSLWKTYYTLMDRPEKAALCEEP